MSQHALRIEGKRMDFELKDLMSIADKMNIKKPMQLIEQVRAAVADWKKFANEVEVEKELAKAIKRTLVYRA